MSLLKTFISWDFPLTVILINLILSHTHFKLAHLTYSLVGQLFKLKNKAEFKEDLLSSYVYYNRYLGKSRPQVLLDTRHEVCTTRSKVNLGVRIGGRPRGVLDLTPIMAVAIIYVNYKFDRKRAPLPLSRRLKDVIIFIFNIIFSITKRY